MPLSNPDNVDRLVEAIQQANKDLEHGEVIYKDLKRNVRRITITLWVAIIGLVLDLSLSIAFIFGFDRQTELNHKVDQNQSTIHTVQCDTDKLFISVDTQQGYAAAPDKAKYVSEFHVIYNSYASLDCQPAIPEPGPGSSLRTLPPGP